MRSQEFQFTFHGFPELAPRFNVSAGAINSFEFLQGEVELNLGQVELELIQQQVVSRVILGETDAEIGRALFISAKRIEEHVGISRKKLDVSGRSGFFLGCLTHGIMDRTRPSNPELIQFYPTDLRIIKLAADGKTNKEIGDDLSQTKQTIDTSFARLKKNGLCSKELLAASFVMAEFFLQS